MNGFAYWVAFLGFVFMMFYFDSVLCGWAAVAAGALLANKIDI